MRDTICCMGRWYIVYWIGLNKKASVGSGRQCRNVWFRSSSESNTKKNRFNCRVALWPTSFRSYTKPFVFQCRQSPLAHSIVTASFQSTIYTVFYVFHQYKVLGTREYSTRISASLWQYSYVYFALRAPPPPPSRAHRQRKSNSSLYINNSNKNCSIHWKLLPLEK